jgi:Plasma-membrane choline transporter
MSKAASLEAVTSLVHLFGLLFIMSGTVAGGWSILATFGDNKVSSPILPIMAFIVIGYLIGNVIMSVYSVSVSTILQCYFVDAEVNSGAKYAPSTLRTVLGEN